LDFKISIVTPSFNQGQYLEATIDSILSQQYPNLEYIIIDGGSTDSSVDIIKKYEKHLAYWVSEKDNGQSQAINKGFRKATGNIINWINSDDLLCKNSLHRVNEIFNNVPDSVGLIHGGTVMFNETGDVYTDMGYDEVNTERYLAGIAFPQPSAFFKRNLLEKTGLLDESHHFKMDYGLYSKMIMHADFLKVPDIFSRYRLHKESKSIALSHKFVNDLIRIFNERVSELKLNFCINILKQLELHAAVKTDENGIQANTKKIDEKKLLFYFLCYIMKHDYAAGNFTRAEKVWHYIKNNYTQTAIDIEKEVAVTGRKLDRYPAWLIKSARKIKS